MKHVFKQPKEPTTKHKILNVRMEPDLKYKFDIACLKNKTNASKAVRSFIENVVNGTFKLV